MIEQFFKSDDPDTSEALERIGALVFGDVFLVGLGKNASTTPKPEGFPLVTEIARADELLLPKKLYDLPEPWPYQEFAGIIEEESGRLKYGSCISEEEVAKTLFVKMKNKAHFAEVVGRRICEIFDRENIVEFLRNRNSGKEIDSKNFEYFAKDVLPHNILEIVIYVTTASYFGGLKNSPVFLRMLEACESGGVPCGWLGPLPDDGGDPKQAVALLHFGKSG